MNDRNLTAEEMVEVAEVFQGSVQHTLSNYSPEGKASLVVFMVELIVKERPYQLVTPEGIAHAIDLIWTRDGIRDFILRLAFVFFSRWGHSDEEVSALARNIARGVAMIKPNEQLNAVPRPLGARLVDINAAQSLIDANPWLMIALMIPMFVSIGTLEQIPPSK